MYTEEEYHKRQSEKNMDDINEKDYDDEEEGNDENEGSDEAKGNGGGEETT